MAKNECCEKFKTMIGGQALIEGIMMRGPDTDAVVIRGQDGITVETMPRKKNPQGSPKSWPFIRGVFNFLDANIVGVKALLHSADLAPEEMQEEPSRFDLWLEKKLGNEKFQQAVLWIAVLMGLGLSVLLFFLLPMVIGGFFDRWIRNTLTLNLVEGVIRMAIFLTYMFLISRMEEMKRVFSYHGAEHKTIRCYEAKLPLTVENVRAQTRLHPRCGTSFLFVVIIISILVFSVASVLLQPITPEFDSGILNALVRVVLKLLLLPIVIGISYEFNRLVGRYDNWLTHALSAPGMWLQYLTTNEPDDSMIEVGIEALTLVLPEQEGSDRW